MIITLKKLNNRFGFNIAKDNRTVIYSSNKHYFLAPFVQSSYQYAWEACRDAWKLAHKYPCKIKRFAEDIEFNIHDDVEQNLTEVSAEQMITNHYVNILRDFGIQSQGLEAEDTEEKEKLYKQISMISSELDTIKDKLTNKEDKKKIDLVLSQYQKLINKYFKEEQRKEQKEKAEAESIEPPVSDTSQPPMPVTASIRSNNNLDDITINELIDNYAQKICSAIQDKHRDAYYSINDDEITVSSFDNDPILKIRINDKLVVDGILPMGKLSDTCPFHSLKFYQSYWKPIVESLGVISHGNILFKIGSKTLPDVSSSSSTHTINGYDMEDNSAKNIDVSFRGEKPIWILEPSSVTKIASGTYVSRHTELDYMNAIVKCVDSKLESIFGRTGMVIQVIPNDDIKIVEVDVDFGRGLGIVRLTEPQIEIVKI